MLMLILSSHVDTLNNILRLWIFADGRFIRIVPTKGAQVSLNLIQNIVKLYVSVGPLDNVYSLEN